MKAERAVVSLPAINTLIEDDPFFSYVRDLRQSIANRAFEFFRDREFEHGHDLEDWLRAESELLEQPALNVSETDDEFSICADVPGLTEREIEVKVDPYRVFITSTREESHGKKEGKSDSSERTSKQFLCEYDLPAEIDPAKVTAELKNGVLTIGLPKRVQSTKIAITNKAA